MRYHALACDYDSTLATHGGVPPEAVDALQRLKNSGRALILVTGRELEDLLRVFPEAAIFDRLVVENGAQLYRPATRESELLAEPPPLAFVERLQERGVSPLSMGKVIVATREPYESTVLETIREMGLEMHVIFNKGGVMALPSGVNKATGLREALLELGLSPHNVVGIGDAENDHAFLELCECALAVANALPAILERADEVTRGAASAGVVELIDRLLKNDLEDLEPRFKRHDVALGTTLEGAPVLIPPYGRGILVAGTSGSGKSTLASSLLEKLNDQDYQFCVIDPEGDYHGLENAVALGTSERAPSVEEAIELLDLPGQNLSVNLLAIPLELRPKFFDELIRSLFDLRRKTGRPHWIVIDEAHHLLPETWAPASSPLPDRVGGVILITISPEHLSPTALSWIDVALALGGTPEATLATFAMASGRNAPSVPRHELQSGEALAWWPTKGLEAMIIRTDLPRASHKRHLRKYAEGELGLDKSFFFRGPEGKLNLRAQNLRIFLQLADGIDDETWLHHLRRGDYSRWFREAIKDEGLALEAGGVEAQQEISARESRELIRKQIDGRYTAPP
jgi:HAD superfamily hydrolase (TIGR01484 family)